MATYWKIAAHPAYTMFSKYKYLIGNLVFSHLGFWSGNFFLFAPFPDHCLFCSLFFIGICIEFGGFKHDSLTMMHIFIQNVERSTNKNKIEIL